MSKLETITIDTPSGSSALQIGDGNTATIGLGKSGDTITIPAGATITNSGTANGFGTAVVVGTEIAYAGRSGNQTSIADNAWTKLAFNSESYDPDSNFDTSNNRYIAPAAGRYYFAAAVNLWGYIGNVQSRFYKNGSAQNPGFFIDNAAYSGNQFEFTVISQALFDLSQNDYIELYVKSNTNSGTTNADELGTNFLAFRLD